MNKVNIEEVRRLYYDKHMSVSAIAKQLDCSMNSIYKQMRRREMPRRSAAEANKAAFEASQLSFSSKKSLTERESVLKNAALMVYWAEGCKRFHGTVDLTNSDPQMICLFVKCLREIYCVNEARLRVLLYCHANQSTEQLKDYWSNVTGIPLSQFTKPYVRQDITSDNHNIMLYGLVHIRYADQRLFMLIQHDIRELVNSCRVSEVAKRD